MRWLLDQGLPRSVAAILNQSSHDAIHVGAVGMAAASDQAILERAASENRVVVTLDADFHALIATRRAVVPSVVRLREEGLVATQIASLLLVLHREFAPQLESGCVMTFSNGKIRYRLLPLA